MLWFTAAHAEFDFSLRHRRFYASRLGYIGRPQKFPLEGCFLGNPPPIYFRVPCSVLGTGNEILPATQ